MCIRERLRERASAHVYMDVRGYRARVSSLLPRGIRISEIQLGQSGLGQVPLPTMHFTSLQQYVFTGFWNLDLPSSSIFQTPLPWQYILPPTLKKGWGSTVIWLRNTKRLLFSIRCPLFAGSEAMCLFPQVRESSSQGQVNSGSCTLLHTWLLRLLLAGRQTAILLIAFKVAKPPGQQSYLEKQLTESSVQNWETPKLLAPGQSPAKGSHLRWKCTSKIRRHQNHLQDRAWLSLISYFHC